MIKFMLNDEMVTTSMPSQTTVLDYVRYHANLRGTKIGCREGDCGACTVLVGTLIDKNMHYESVTSCLTPLANVHGKHVVTVEGLNINGLNIVQEAMVQNSGTQCGFCTPGFIVSLCGYVLNKVEKKGHDLGVISAIDGNICRCTGYKSIERAADTIVEKLSEIDPNRPLEWLVEHKWLPQYFLEVKEKMYELIAPLLPSKSGKPIGGGTDLYVQKHDHLHEMELKYVFRPHLEDTIIFTETHCMLKASCTATNLMECQRLQDIFPRWIDYLKWVSSTPIRNIGTVSGNLMNASPIGDLTIMLLALNADVTFINPENKKRKVALKDLYLGYKKLDKTEDELLDEISFKIPKGAYQFNFEKVCKRPYLDIASVNTACMIFIEKDTITEASLSIGGVSAIPFYLEKTSNFLVGRKISTLTVKQCISILDSEISPISDVRGTADYKRLLARQLVYAHFVTLFPQYIKMKDLVW